MVRKLPSFHFFMACSIKDFFHPEQSTLVDRKFTSQGPLFSTPTRKSGMLVPLNHLLHPKRRIMSPSQIPICVLYLQLCLKWKNLFF
jgi:hypothetical protein